MTIRTLNTDGACAKTFARLDDSITVARTGENVLLLNMPRKIEDLAAVAQEDQQPSLFDRMKNFFRA